jgi:group I intron endonuclease
MTKDDITTLLGVYQIRNIENGALYIGSTAKTFAGRWHKHREFLRADKHHARHLQFAWNKYGEASFAFEILEVIDDPNLVIEREQVYIDACFQTMPRERIYNTRPTAGSQLGLRHTDKSRQLMSEKQRANQTPERRKQQGATLSSTLRRKWNEDAEYREKMSARNKQVFSTDEHRAKRREIAQALWETDEYRSKVLRGREAHNNSAETRLLRSRQSLERWANPEFKARAVAKLYARYDGKRICITLISPSGEIVVIASIRQFAKEHGLHYQGIYKLASGKTKSHRRWRIYTP